jgi:hypothetical protein
MKPKVTAKRILGELPLTADLYWLLWQSEEPPIKNYYLNKLEAALPHWVDQVLNAKVPSKNNGKKVLIFAALHYWISHTTLIGTTLAGFGYDVVLMYLPYARWEVPINRFDLRRQDLYSKRVLRKAEPILQSVSLLDIKGQKEPLPEPIMQAVEEISLRDTQYTNQLEIVDQNSDLFKLRMARNSEAASKALNWMKSEPPDVVIIPNGSILEMGIFYRVARYLGIPTTSYEFGEQRNRIWLALNKEVMRQETDDLWAVFRDYPVSESELKRLRELFASRQKADLWKNFSRRWQVSPSRGGEEVRQSLNLDDRPVILLAANVIGDSLTLGRQIFSENMTEWLQRTVQYIAERSDLQLVVRIHPGERYTQGPSVAGIVKQALLSIPENIRLIGADEKINTYDLVEIADLGLVYTTTVGLEMAMSGIPVVVVGQTHYREKGFTLDPSSWEDYFNLLERYAQDPQSFQLSAEQVDLAWQYAYNFFFKYPAPFPWPMPRFWKELVDWPIDRVLSAEGLSEYGDTFRYLVGEPRKWTTS